LIVWTGFNLSLSLDT